MTTIDDKLELFNKLIFEKIYDEKKIEMDKFVLDKEKILEEEKLKNKTIREIEIKEWDKKGKIKSSEIISKERIDISQKKIILKKSILEDLMNSVKDKTKEFTKTLEYKTFLFNLLDGVIGELENKNYIIYLTPEDIKKYGEEIKEKVINKTKSKLIIKESELDIIGGIIIEEEEGNYRINNTLLGKIQDSREYAGLLLTKLLE